MCLLACEHFAAQSIPAERDDGLLCCCDRFPRSAFCFQDNLESTFSTRSWTACAWPGSSTTSTPSERPPQTTSKNWWENVTLKAISVLGSIPGGSHQTSFFQIQFCATPTLEEEAFLLFLFLQLSICSCTSPIFYLKKITSSTVGFIQSASSLVHATRKKTRFVPACVPTTPFTGLTQTWSELGSLKRQFIDSYSKLGLPASLFPLA